MLGCLDVNSEDSIVLSSIDPTWLLPGGCKRTSMRHNGRGKAVLFWKPGHFLRVLCVHLLSYLLHAQHTLLFQECSCHVLIWFVGSPFSPVRSRQGFTDFSVTYLASLQGSQTGQVVTVDDHDVLPDWEIQKMLPVKLTELVHRERTL